MRPIIFMSNNQVKLTFRRASHSVSFTKLGERRNNMFDADVLTGTKESVEKQAFDTFDTAYTYVYSVFFSGESEKVKLQKIFFDV